MTIKQTIGIRNTVSIGLLLLFFVLPLHAIAKEWNIGVLALRGDASTQRHWLPLVQTLNEQLPSENFVLVPLNLEEMKLAVAKKRLISY